MKTLILTLRKYPHRRKMMEVALKMRGYPMDKVLFWYGNDAMHHGHPPLSYRLALKAIGDGFGFFKHTIVEDGCYPNIHILSQHWEFCRIWRHIAQQDDVVMVLHDDVLPKLSYSQLAVIVRHLKQMGDFKLYHYVWTTRNGNQYSSQTKKSPIPYIREGLTGHGDKINILSPEGAAWMLALTERYVAKYKNASAEDIFDLRENDNIPKGVYSTEPDETKINMDWGRHVEQLISPKDESNIMFYGETHGDFEFKVPIEDTCPIAPIDWHYYETVLPRLKESYALLNNTLHA